MKNKGFVTTGMLFIILLLFLALYSSLLAMFSNRRKIYETIKDDIMNDSNITSRNYYLSTANIGDYVSYPIKYTNKTCIEGSANVNSGWRILNITDNTVTIVSSGTPECYNPKTFTDSGVASKQKINTLLSKYLNTTYGTSVRSLNGNDFFNLTGVDYNLCYNTSSIECGSDNDLINTGSYYWLDDNYGTNSLYYWMPINEYLSAGYNSSYGLRVVIELKDAITYSKGIGTKNNPYVLIKP